MKRTKKTMAKMGWETEKRDTYIQSPGRNADLALGGLVESSYGMMTRASPTWGTNPGWVIITVDVVVDPGAHDANNDVREARGVE